MVDVDTLWRGLTPILFVPDAETRAKEGQGSTSKDKPSSDKPIKTADKPARSFKLILRLLNLTRSGLITSIDWKLC